MRRLRIEFLNIEWGLLYSIENRNDASSKLNIVDGQRRLTTFSILLFVVYEILQETSYANLSSLLNEEYNELSREAIVNNLQIIKRKLREFDRQEVKKYADYLLDNCSFGKDYHE